MKLHFLAIATLAVLTFTSCGKDKKKTTYSVPVKKEKVIVAPKTVEKVVEKANDLTTPTLDNKGVGEIKSVTLATIDDAMVAKGKALYKTNCTACHKFKKRYIGPALKGITERRSPEWIMNMIINPELMIKKDPVAKALLAEYSAPMANQHINKEDARAILEYFRTKN